MSDNIKIILFKIGYFIYPKKNCYILIIPGFGIISHIVSTFSGKPIFGQDGPKYLFDILKQTICRKLSITDKQNTIQISHIFNFLIFFNF